MFLNNQNITEEIKMEIKNKKNRIPNFTSKITRKRTKKPKLVEGTKS